MTRSLPAVVISGCLLGLLGSTPALAQDAGDAVERTEQQRESDAASQRRIDRPVNFIKLAQTNANRAPAGFDVYLSGHCVEGACFGSTDYRFFSTENASTSSNQVLERGSVYAPKDAQT